MENYGAVITGRYIYAVRNDGREFVGRIANVKALPKGTLVTIENADGENGFIRFQYKNVYLENLKDWTVYADEVDLASAVS